MKMFVAALSLAAFATAAAPLATAAQEPEQERAVPRMRDAEVRSPEVRSAPAPAPEPAGRQEVARAPQQDAGSPQSAFDQESAAQRQGGVRRPGGAGGSGGGDRSGGARARGDGDRGGDRADRGGSGRSSGSGDGFDGFDRAVPRSSVARVNRPVYVYGGAYPWYYSPWGYGGLGIGYSYFSPFGWYGDFGGPGFWGAGPGFGWGRGYGYGYDAGGVRLRVSPRDAEVYVDGYYAGIVDDFDGTFQSLKLNSGGYRIEVRKPGYETLSFDVRVQFDRTITYRGEMRQLP